MPVTAPILLLLHGLGSSAKAFDPLLPLLPAESDARTVELPGFGERHREPAAPSIEAMAAAVEPEVHAAAESGRPVVVVGHSMGGCVATALAEAGRAPVSGLVLVNTSLTIEGRHAARSGSEGLIRRPVIGRFAWRAATRERLRHGLRTAFAPGFAVPDVFVDDLAACAWRAFTGSTAAMDAWLAAAPLADRLAALSTPTAYVYGPLDQRITPESLADFRARGVAPMLEIDGSGHTPMWERPAAMAEALAGALAGLAPIASPPTHR